MRPAESEGEAGERSKQASKQANKKKEQKQKVFACLFACKLIAHFVFCSLASGLQCKCFQIGIECRAFARRDHNKFTKLSLARSLPNGQRRPAVRAGGALTVHHVEAQQQQQQEARDGPPQVVLGRACGLGAELIIANACWLAQRGEDVRSRRRRLECGRARARVCPPAALKICQGFAPRTFARSDKGERWALKRKQSSWDDNKKGPRQANDWASK